MKQTGTFEKSNMPVLFKVYPELEKKLAWIALGDFPTPVQRLQHMGHENLWIKRDDLSSSIYGGNKIRKLEFILGHAKKNKKSAGVITFGGIGTNHGVATAIYCNKLKIPCKLLLFWQPVTEHVQHNLLLIKKYNTKLVYKETLWKTVMGYYLFERLKHPTAYFVFAGGSNVVGTIGYVDAAFELKAQIDRGEIAEPGVIMCALGSGGTLSGLSLGVQLAGLNTKVIGVRVSESHLGPFQACTPATVKKLMSDTYKFLRRKIPKLPDLKITPPQILQDYIGEGYGFPTPEGNTACRKAQESENIILEPTYTAKTFAAVMDYCQGPGKNSRPILYWNTYNSIDLSNQAASVDYQKLPKSLQPFIKQTPIAI